MKATKKAITVEAVELTKEMLLGVAMPMSGVYLKPETPDSFTIYTPNGPVVAHVGDYVIVGVEGEVYPISREIFQKTYFPVEEGGVTNGPAHQFYRPDKPIVPFVENPVEEGLKETGLKFFTEKVAFCLDKKPIGVVYIGFQGFVKMELSIMNNGSIGLRHFLGNVTPGIGLNRQAVDDLKIILTGTDRMGLKGTLSYFGQKGDMTMEDRKIGDSYRGWTGSIEVDLGVMENGTISLGINGMVLGFSTDAVEDLKTLLGANSVALAS